MIQARIGAFETNSSTYCSLYVMVAQVEGLNIPPIVKFESGGSWSDDGLKWIYWRAEYANELDKLFGLLKHAGVKEIFVDNKPIEGEYNDWHTKFMPEVCILAKCFGDFKTYSEWDGSGDEWDNTSFLKPSEILAIQNKIKDPNYEVICTDGAEDNPEIIDFPYIDRKITNEDLERERKARQYKNEPDLWIPQDETELIEDTEPEDPYDTYTNKIKDKENKNRKK